LPSSNFSVNGFFLEVGSFFPLLLAFGEGDFNFDKTFFGVEPEGNDGGILGAGLGADV